MLDKCVRLCITADGFENEWWLELRANCRPLHRVKLRGRVAKVHRKMIDSAASVDCVIVGGADGLTNRCGTTHAKVDMRVLSSLLA